MLAFEIEYLRGKVCASDRSHREKPEFPPNPNRLFSALVATAHECGMGAKAFAALTWLENLESPSIWADPPCLEDTVPPAPMVWVPVNDTHSASGAPIKAGIPLSRKRAERYFPSFCPHTPRVYFIWKGTDDQENIHKPVLSEIACNLAYLGHSSSLVRACLKETNLPEANLVPRTDGEFPLRVPGPGRLKRLEDVYQASLNCGRRIEPPMGLFRRYGLARDLAKAPQTGPFRVAAVFRKAGGNSLPYHALGLLASTVRKALLSQIPDPIPEVLSGHGEDGSPSNKLHLAIAPLANVGNPHADGHLMGFSLFVPRSISDSENRLLEQALVNLRQLRMGRAGEWTLSRCDTVSPLRLPDGLHTRSLTRPSRVWTAATPMAFGHWPKKNKAGKRVEDLIMKHCVDSGLPEPVSIEWDEKPLLKGTAPARTLQNARQLRQRQFLAYVRLRFDVPLRGPLVLGAGKYIGFGLLLPTPEREVRS